VLLHLLILWAATARLFTPPPEPAAVEVQARIEQRTVPPEPPPPVALVRPVMPEARMPVVPAVETPPLANAITLPPPPPRASPAPPGPVAPPAPKAPPPDYLSRLFARINAYKHYPRAALSARIQGRPVVHFVMDRRGRVLSCVISKSSGVPVLDEAAVAAVTDAQPLPPLPPDIPGETYSVTVGINFQINR
jgi:protein TonB